MAKLDVGAVVKDHLDTLYDYGTDRRSVRDYVWFFAVPIAIAAVLFAAGVQLDLDAITVLITALSIFAGLLLNLLLLTHSIVTKPVTDEPSKRRRRLIKEVYQNISFSVLIALGTVSVLAIMAVLRNSLVTSIGSAIVFAMTANFLLTLLMILKRVHVMLGHEYEENGG